MKRDEAVELIRNLSGDEHDWVDFKQDYYVIGIELKKAEFVKDVAAMANTVSDRQSHYIIIGVNDNTGELVGVSESYREDDNSDSDGPKHILSLNDAHLQTVLTEYISPPPNINLYKFTNKDPKFGVLEINPTNKKPCVIEKSIDFSGSTHLQEGLIYTRKASRNTIVTRSTLEEIIDERVSDRREEILDGITKAIQIGPEAVSKLGDIVHDEEGDLTIDVGEDADFILNERITREPVSDLDNQLDQDISQWAGRNEIEIGLEPLWRYYASSDDITIDEQAVLFLTHASIKHGTFGLYWLENVEMEKIRDILESIPSKYHQNKRAATAYAALGDHEGLQSFSEQRDASTEAFSSLLETAGESPQTRREKLINSKYHKINTKDIDIDIDIASMDSDEIRSYIPKIADDIYTAESNIDGYNSWVPVRNDIRNLLCDLEVALSIPDDS